MREMHLPRPRHGLLHTYAGHHPTRRFSKEEWESMPVGCGCEDHWPSGGFTRYEDKAGRAIVGFYDDDNWRGGYLVRPIIVVKVSNPAQRSHPLDTPVYRNLKRLNARAS